MDQLDALTIQFLNQVVNQFEALDRFMVHLKGNNLVKGGVLLSLYWWAWFSTERAMRCVLL